MPTRKHQLIYPYTSGSYVTLDRFAIIIRFPRLPEAPSATTPGSCHPERHHNTIKIQCAWAGTFGAVTKTFVFVLVRPAPRNAISRARASTARPIQGYFRIFIPTSRGVFEDNDRILTATRLRRTSVPHLPSLPHYSRPREAPTVYLFAKHGAT